MYRRSLESLFATIRDVTIKRLVQDKNNDDCEGDAKA